MKTWLGSGVVALCVMACSSTSSTTPSAENSNGNENGNKPQTQEEQPEPTVDEVDAAPSCDCPSSCASATEKKWTVCSPKGEAPKTVPATEKIGKFFIGNFEYWPYAKPSPYPNDTICGYNGDQECGWNGAAKGKPNEAARVCMAEARAALVDILKHDVPPELDELRTKHSVFQFWNWNNDMTGTKSGVPSTRDLWLYEGDRGDGGLIKWISETERDGKCHLPTREDLVTFAKACVKSFPNCDSGK